MNTEELLSELDVAYKSIHKISNAIASKEGIANNPDYQYLKDKIDGFCHTADHVRGQMGVKLREQKAKRKKS